MTINIDRAFSWYYQFFPSVISSEGLEMKNLLSETYPDDQETNKRILNLANYAYSCKLPDEKAECLAFAALRAGELGCNELAIDLFKQSGEFLPQDVRAASLLWCLGWANEQNGNRTQAYGNWFASRLLISELLKTETMKSVSDKGKSSNIEWFESVLAEMNLHLARIPEEGLYWLHLFDNTGGSDLVKKYEKKITDWIMQNRFPSARQEIEDMLKLSRSMPDISRQGDAFLVASVAESEMGNPDRAIVLMMEGLSKYRKECHKQMCGKWTAGLISWENKQKRVQARQYLESALHEAKELVDKSDRFQNNKSYWYSARSKQMEQVIGELID